MKEAVIITDDYMNITENNVILRKRVQNDPHWGGGVGVSGSGYLRLTLERKRPESRAACPSVSGHLSGSRASTPPWANLQRGGGPGTCNTLTNEDTF